MKDVVIVSACRTAIGEFGGTLKNLNTPVIGSVVMKEAVKRAGIDPAMIDDVRFGCCMEPVDALNVTRIAALMAGIPETVTAVTVNRVCISGMEAVLSGAALIRGEMADIILAGGMEHMSGAVYSVPAVRDLLARGKMKLEDFDLIEVNEAFAAQYLGCERELGLNREITNVNGSGCGLGHPVGSTGCRVMVTLLHSMKKRGKTLGLATLCGGGGVSLACALEMI